MTGRTRLADVQESGGWAITEPQIGAALSPSEGNLPQLVRPGSRAGTA
jgi:hypothetical protein